MRLDIIPEFLICNINQLLKLYYRCDIETLVHNWYSITKFDVQKVFSF